MVAARLLLGLACLAGFPSASPPPPPRLGDDPYSQRRRQRQGDLSALGAFSTRPPGSYAPRMPAGLLTPHVGLLSAKTSAYRLRFNDPMWTKQWYMQDYRTEDSPVYDHNVVPVYNMNINGTGVTVAVVDEGVQSDNPDLIGNYVARLSHDYLKKKKGAAPALVREKGWQHRRTHGTRAAGVIAMTADNGLCGVGFAFGAKIAGVVVIGSNKVGIFRSTDYIDSKGLVHKLQEVDIYSCSWGFERQGEILKEPPRLTFKAISKGVTEGRGGKGAIYVFSAGNKKSEYSGGNGREPLPVDNCASDGLTNNPHVIVIASASQWGRATQYSEACTNVFATAYSSGKADEEKLVTTDANLKCTEDFGATSAAAAVASGIIALLLSANKQLTYRDVMHLIAAGSEVAPLAENNPTWYTNAAGFAVSNDFGFGLLNAENMVLLAVGDWKRVPDKKVCVISIKVNKKVYFELELSQTFVIDTNGCQDSGEDGVYFLEQVELASTVHSLTQIERGDFAIYLTSPRGTTSVLMKPRAPDRSKSGFKNWSITSVHNWGENPRGRWKIHVFLHDYDKTWPMLSSAQSKTSKDLTSLVNSMERRDSSKDGDMSGVVKGFTLTLHGTTEKPAHYENKPPYRQYAPYHASDATLNLP